MELPFRAKGDELLPPGAMTGLRERLRGLTAAWEAHAGRGIRTVAVHAFDNRTRLLPFIFYDRRMFPGGIRGLGSALADVGCPETRLVFQQWNPRFEPSQMRLGGAIPDLFLLSTMSIHGGRADALLRDVCKIPAAERPLVIVGGPRHNYEPWRAFGTDSSDPWGADVATTGEVFVFLSLLEALLEGAAPGESLRATFFRLRDAGALQDIPGLVYAEGPVRGAATALVDTGIQRLLGNLDELPSPLPGYSQLEAPSRRATLADAPVPASRVGKLTPISIIELSYGCKFRCPYCPIPAYNQHQDRAKSPARIASEMAAIYETYGIARFFGADDNFFNRKERALAIATALAEARLSDGRRLGKVVRWGTEVTVHDTLQMKEHMNVLRRAGCRWLWLGVEDMTATLVKKGQSVDKTREAFAAMRAEGISPMPMMMHDDSQPLVSFKGPRGLLNQIQLLRNAGAMTCQVMLLNPAQGTKLYKETYETGLTYERVNGKTVEPHMHSGNHLVASRAKRPYLRQFNVTLAYSYFYNPIRLLLALVWSRSPRGWFVDSAFQTMGNLGVLRNWWETPKWMWHLWWGRKRIKRTTEVPRPAVPLRDVHGALAAHALPEGPDPKKVRRLPTAPDAVSAGSAASA